MRNQWKITKDLINECFGTETEEEITSSRFAFEREMPIFFRMYDDDDVLYFEGVMEIEDFHPLDDFGMPAYGCTWMETSRDNKTFMQL